MATWNMFEITMASGEVEHVVARDARSAAALAVIVRPGDAVLNALLMRPAEWAEARAAIEDEYAPRIAAALPADRQTLRDARQVEYDAARAEDATLQASKVTNEEVAS